MSFPRIVPMSGRVLEDKALSGTAKLVAAFIEVQAMAAGNAAGWVRPKQKEIAEALGVSRETVNRALKQLVPVHVETRNVTSANRGRVGLEYRVRFDPEDRTAIDAITTEPKADVTETAPATTQADQPMCAKRHPIRQADVMPASLRVADVIQFSPKTADVTTPDVIKTSLPYRDITNSLSSETHTNKDTLRPKLSAKAKSLSDPSPAFLGLWELWEGRDLVRRSKRKPAWETYQGLLRAGAKHHTIEMGMRAYLGDESKTREGGKWMPELFRWLRDEVWRDWADIARINGVHETPEDWNKRLAYFRKEQKWFPDRWGPPPGDDGYRGPTP